MQVFNTNNSGRKTLILTTSHTAVAQWRNELLSKTDLGPEDVGEYTGLAKEVRPVTVTTLPTHRSNRNLWLFI